MFISTLLKAFIKPFEAPQRSVGIKVNFFFSSGTGTLRDMKKILKLFKACVFSIAYNRIKCFSFAFVEK